IGARGFRGGARDRSTKRQRATTAVAHGKWRDSAEISGRGQRAARFTGARSRGANATAGSVGHASGGRFARAGGAGGRGHGERQERLAGDVDQQAGSGADGRITGRPNGLSEAADVFAAASIPADCAKGGRAVLGAAASASAEEQDD